MISYDAATPEERNAACAAYMPASDVNPIRSWWVTLDGVLWSRLAVRSKDEADSWLRIASMSRHNWERVMTEWPWSLRSSVGVAEHHHHVRYTDTPGGAWDLLEQMVSESWEVAVTCTGSFTTVTAVKGSRQLSAVSDQAMPVLAGAVFLLAHNSSFQSRFLVRR